MEVLFENKTKYTKEAYYKFLKAYNKKFGIKFKLSVIFMVIFLVYSLILNIRDSKFTISVWIAAILLAVLLYSIVFQKRTIKKELKSEKFENEEEFTFTFYEEKITIKKGNESDTTPYYRIYKLDENEEYYYLYLNIRQAYIIKKDMFTKGDTEEFKFFIKNKLKHKINNRIKNIKK